MVFKLNFDDNLFPIEIFVIIVRFISDEIATQMSLPRNLSMLLADEISNASERGSRMHVLLKMPRDVLTYVCIPL